MDDCVFHFIDGVASFEDLGVKNGVTHWSEELVRNSLGYQSESSFRSVVSKAMQTCLTLGIELEENFKKQADGTYVLTRFACYLIAMNGDTKKPEVAAAQAYFATLAETFQSAIEHVDGIDRILIRDEVTAGEKSLASTASQHGVQCYPFFQNAGYRGMYNMNYSQLLEHKGVGAGKKMIDYMGRTELAAHLYRVTQTDEKIKATGATGQRSLENIAHTVGRMVRGSMIQISGKKPENLPAEEHVKEVRKKIKGASKSLKKLDGKKKSP